MRTETAGTKLFVPTHSKKQRLQKGLFLVALLSMALPLYGNEAPNGYRLLELSGFKLKWGQPELGLGAVIRYAFADEVMRFEHARNCAELAPMSTLSSPELTFDAIQHETAAAFKVWESAADLAFHQVDDPRDADIVLGVQGRPVGRAFANVSYRQEARDGVRLIDQALICLNPDQKWKIGFDGNTEVYDLRYTLIHEIGHAVGLDHPGPEGQIMGFAYTERITGLQPGDVRGIRLLYGPPAVDGALTVTPASMQTPDRPLGARAQQASPSLPLE
ncbi:MAG: matrixin family metalloprotease [Wenzhouxiangella sp.]